MQEIAIRSIELQQPYLTFILEPQGDPALLQRIQKFTVFNALFLLYSPTLYQAKLGKFFSEFTVLCIYVQKQVHIEQKMTFSLA